MRHRESTFLGAAIARHQILVQLESIISENLTVPLTPGKVVHGILRLSARLRENDIGDVAALADDLDLSL